MTESEVVGLMKSSRDESEWNRNADEVKRRCGGDYPPFWFRAVVVSLVMAEAAGKWEGVGV